MWPNLLLSSDMNLTCDKIKYSSNNVRQRLKLQHKEIEKRTSDIYGNKLKFSVIKHGLSSCCKEYIVTREAFNYRRWSFCTIIFSILAFYSEVYNTDINFLGVVFFSLCLILLLKLHFKVRQESLFVIASLGLQFTTTFVTGRKASQFILKQNIKDVVINEAITMHRVLHYLAILLRDSNDSLGIKAIVPLFQNTLPRLDALEKIYQGAQVAFYAEK